MNKAQQLEAKNECNQCRKAIFTYTEKTAIYGGWRSEEAPHIGYNVVSVGSVWYFGIV